MKAVQQPKAGPARGSAPPGARWVMFWLFWTYYALAGLEVTLAVRRSSEGLGLSIATFSALTFLAGVLATAGLSARSEGVGLLVWVERFPEKLIQSAQLTGLALVLLALYSGTPWGAGLELLYESAFMLGFALAALAIFCNVRPLFGRRWTWRIGARKSGDPAGGSN